MLTRFGKDYFQSPFFIWSIIILIVTIFYSNREANKFLQSLLIDNLYLPIFIFTQSVAIIIAIYPIKKGLKDFYKTKNKKTKILNEVLLYCTFGMFTPIFLIDQRMILATLWQSSIVDRIQYDFAVQAYVLYQFVGLPVVQFYNIELLRSRLRKENFETEDKFRNNVRSIFLAILISIGYSTLAYFVTSTVLH